MFQCQ